MNACDHAQKRLFGRYSYVFFLVRPRTHDMSAILDQGKGKGTGVVGSEASFGTWAGIWV